MHVRNQKRSLTIIAAILLLILALPAAAQAQDTISLSSFSVRIWPEFDRPSALVIISGEVENAELPVELQFSIPETAAVNAAAYVDPATGDLLTTQNMLDNGLLTLPEVDPLPPRKTGPWRSSFPPCAPTLTRWRSMK